MALYQNLIATSAPASVILIRLVVGGVFLSEGIQKFLAQTMCRSDQAGRLMRSGFESIVEHCKHTNNGTLR
jgi:uncharacterized membrane protein YphA (DoxX/SURF4 family)